MAKINIYESYWPAKSTFNEEYFHLHYKSKNEILYTDGSGAFIEMRGDEFRFSGDRLVAGTIKSIEIDTQGGNIALEAKNLNVTSSVFNFYFDHGGVSAFDYVHTLGRDVIVGSSGDDILRGGDKNDRILGKAGDDYFLAERGVDTFGGGGGADVFCLTFRQFGAVVINDFDDVGTVQDTMIVSRWMYRAMDIEQVGQNTVLHFAEQEVTLLDFRANNIDKGDFDFEPAFG
ncbi:hypothetical protein [Rhizobium sp. G21]|uniref:hypothetical protein n=1 Tax=Rhizobium sp. G21 TaxID=2758439 RepID=UPI0015FF1109|nr:hypothetical protein [Rhizobium sp. G21]MBB1248354.1 hypothetical protein [Rhizobium sp. G21]